MMVKANIEINSSFGLGAGEKVYTPPKKEGPFGLQTRRIDLNGEQTKSIMNANAHIIAGA